MCDKNPAILIDKIVFYKYTIMVRNKREDIAMLIQFSVSNFLSFNEKETFSMIAGKARKNIDRVFSNKKIKLTKCEVILGANASGKSNLVSAFQFAQSVIVDGLPRGFSGGVTVSDFQRCSNERSGCLNMTRGPAKRITSEIFSR